MLTKFRPLLLGQALTLATIVAASPAESQITRDSRFVFGADVGVQMTINTRLDTVDFELFGETSRFTAAQELGRGTVYGVGGATRAWKRLGVGVYLSRVRTVSAATVEAHVPHPFFFEFPRFASAQVDRLVHRESALHVHGQYWLPIGSQLLLTLSAGPTFFGTSQDLVSEITTAEHGFPFEEADIASHTTQELKATAAGFNMGVDVAFFGLRQLGFLRSFETLDHVGVAFSLRHSRATSAVEFKGRKQPALELGGTHAMGGIRVAF